MPISRLCKHGLDIVWHNLMHNLEIVRKYKCTMSTLHKRTGTVRLDSVLWVFRLSSEHFLMLVESKRAIVTRKEIINASSPR